MNTRINWTKVSLLVVLAVASLSWTTGVAAMSAPHRDRLVVLADLCGVANVSQFDQYMAAINWAEQGGPAPDALTVSCVEDSVDRVAWNAGYGGESWARFEQYMAAVEGRALELDAASVRTVTGSEARFEQYSAAINWAEQGGPVPQALTVSYGEDNLNDITPVAGDGGESWTRFEQYMAAVEGRTQELDAAPVRTVAGGQARLEQYMAPVNSTGKVRTFAPQRPTGEYDLDLFAQYLAAVANAGYGPTFASEADRGAPK